MSERKLDVILVRHAQSSNNMIFGQVRGDLGEGVSIEEMKSQEALMRDPDCGLSPKGFMQLEHLAAYDWADCFAKLKGTPKCAVYTSPMKRCLHTARAVASSLSSYMVHPVHVKEDLFEDGGCYTRDSAGKALALAGSTSSDIQREFPDYVCPSSIDHGWFFGRSVEKEAEFFQRIEGLIQWLWKLQETAVEAHSVTTVVLVAHGNVISCLLSGLLSGDPKGSLYCLDNTAHAHVELFDYDGRRIATCQAVNSTAHLRGQRDLVTGGRSLDDLWIQDYVAGFGVNESTDPA